MSSLDVYRRDVHEVKGVGGKVENMQKTKMAKNRKEVGGNFCIFSMVEPMNSMNS